MDLEARVRVDHPLRAIRDLVNEALSAMGSDLSALYSGLGRPSIAPERLLRAMLLQAFYSIRSERQLMERLEFDLLFRWFVGLGIDDAVWDRSTFSKNRDRLLAGDVAAQFLSAVLAGRRTAAVELARAIDHRNRGLTMQVNKVHPIRTLALVARDLGEDADWLADIAIDMEPEDGLDAIMASGLLAPRESNC